MLILAVGEVEAREVEVKAGNVQVSVQNGEVEVNTGANSLRTPSLLERLTNLRLFNHRSSHSTSQSNFQCDRSSYSTSNHRNSKTGVSQTSSSSTTMVCQ